MTPTWPLRVADSTARTPGSITPTTGTPSDRPQLVEVGGGRRRVAGHHDELHVVLVDQPASDLVGEPPDLVQRPRPVGVATGVADVDERLARADRSMRARATVSPPKPLSNMPIGRGSTAGQGTGAARRGGQTLADLSARATRVESLG